MIAPPQYEVMPSSGDISRGRRWILVQPAWLLALVVVVGISIVHVLYPDGVVGNISYISVTTGAAVVAWIGARRRTGPRRFA